MAKSKPVHRVPKQRMPKTKRVAKEGSDPLRSCEHCGATKKVSEFRAVMPSLLDPTRYACDLDHYRAWVADREAKGLPSWGGTQEKAPEVAVEPPPALF